MEGNEKTRISKMTIGRLHNLGNYEHVRYEITIDIGDKDNPADVLNEVENILNDLHAKIGVSEWDLRNAKEVLNKPVSELTSIEASNLKLYKKRVADAELALEKRQKARDAMRLFGGTYVYKDAKVKWDDEY